MRPTHFQQASQMQNSPWLQGPGQLYKKCQSEVMPGNGTFSLVDPETDKEVKPVLAVHVMKTSIENHNVFGTHDSTSSHPGLLL